MGAMMNKKIIMLSLICFFSCVCILLVYLLFRMFDDACKQSASIGMISAIGASLAQELEEGNPIIRRTLGDISKGLTLNSDQYDKVVKELVSKGHNLDPPSKWDINKPLFDPWGNRLVIWCKQLPDGQYMLKVTSKGKDGRLGTDDDISSGERKE
jgi:hypothetical protein